MFKNKREQNWNDEKFSQNGHNCWKSYQSWRCQSDCDHARFNAASSSWRSPFITVKQDLEITSAALRANNCELALLSFPMPHQSLQPSFTALSSRAIFMFRWVRLSLIHKTLVLNSLFSHFPMKKLVLWTKIRPDFTEHSTFRAFHFSAFWRTSNEAFCARGRSAAQALRVRDLGAIQSRTPGIVEWPNQERWYQSSWNQSDFYHITVCLACWLFCVHLNLSWSRVNFIWGLRGAAPQPG